MQQVRPNQKPVFSHWCKGRTLQNRTSNCFVWFWIAKSLNRNQLEGRNSLISETQISQNLDIICNKHCQKALVLFRHRFRISISYYILIVHFYIQHSAWKGKILTWNSLVIRFKFYWIWFKVCQTCSVTCFWIFLFIHFAR